jgi:hypothetical protein
LKSLRRRRSSEKYNWAKVKAMKEGEDVKKGGRDRTKEEI